METAAYRGRTHVSTRLRTKIPEDTSCISGGVHTCPVTEKAHRPNRESIQSLVPIVNPNFGLKNWEEPRRCDPYWLSEAKLGFRIDEGLCAELVRGYISLSQA